MIHPVLVDKRSPFIGEACALCKEPFTTGDEIVICPEDASRHHARCWRANGGRCAAYGCEGEGEITELADSPVGPSPATAVPSDVQTMPSSSFGCAQSCLLISIALSILFFAVGCFGLWAIADYIMLEVLGWSYRAPLTGSLPEISVWLTIPLLML